jgi:hypothetical protein
MGTTHFWRGLPGHLAWALATAVGIFFLLASLVGDPAGPLATSAEDRAGNGWGIRNARGFSLLSTIHAIDNGWTCLTSTRLTLIPHASVC